MRGGKGANLVAPSAPLPTTPSAILAAALRGGTILAHSCVTRPCQWNNHWLHLVPCTAPNSWPRRSLPVASCVKPRVPSAAATPLLSTDPCSLARAKALSGSPCQQKNRHSGESRNPVLAIVAGFEGLDTGVRRYDESLLGLTQSAQKKTSFPRRRESRVRAAQCFVFYKEKEQIPGFPPARE